MPGLASWANGRRSWCGCQWSTDCAWRWSWNLCGNGYVGPATSQELSRKTSLHERQLREWLSAQAASGYVTYDAVNETFYLTAEQAAVFADPNSPAAMTGGFYR